MVAAANGFVDGSPTFGRFADCENKELSMSVLASATRSMWINENLDIPKFVLFIFLKGTQTLKSV